MSRVELAPPNYTPEPGCIKVELPMGIASGRSLTTGLSGPERIRTRMFKRDRGDVCVCTKGDFAVLTKTKIEALNAWLLDPKGLLKNSNWKWADDDAR